MFNVTGCIKFGLLAARHLVVDFEVFVQKIVEEFGCAKVEVYFFGDGLEIVVLALFTTRITWSAPQSFYFFDKLYTFPEQHTNKLNNLLYFQHTIIFHLKIHLLRSHSDRFFKVSYRIFFRF